MEKFHLSLLWDCNENCRFCLKKAPAIQVNRALSLRECLAALKSRRAAGCRHVSLDGGEPALRPDLPRIIKAALLLGYRKIDVMTNGTRFSDPALACAFAALGPGIEKKLFFCVSLHSRRPDISDALTRCRGGFNRTVAGIKNLLAVGFTVSISHVITRPAYRDLPAFAEFVRTGLKGVSGVVFSHIYPVMHGLSAIKGIYPRLSDARPFLEAAVSRLAALGIKVDFGNSEMAPVCLAGGREAFFAEAYLRSSVAALTYDRNKLETSDSRKLESMPQAADEFSARNKVKGPVCRRCLLSGVCAGVWKFYAELYGFGELRPYRPDFLSAIKNKSGEFVIRVAGKMPSASAASRARVRALAARLRGRRELRFIFPREMNKKHVQSVLKFAARIGAAARQGKGQ